MRSGWHAAMLAGAMAGLRVGVASAEPLFVSPPHFLTLHDRQQVIFFVNESVAGALASRTGVRTIQVFVPHASVDPSLLGASFHGDKWSGAAVTDLTLSSGTRGNAQIRIETSQPVGGVHAYSVDDPPRLIIDLLATVPTPAPTPARTMPSRRTAVGSAARAREPARAPSTGRTPAPAAHVATAAGAVAAQPPRATPAAIAAAPSGGDPLVLPPTLAVAMTAPTRQEGNSERAGTQPRRAGVSESSWPCRWRRVSGVAFCAPSPAAVPYAADAALANVASALGEEAPRPPALPGGEGPARMYLAADREFARRAPSRRLLPAIDLYRRALYRFPAFFDAGRARLNIALAYRAMGFAAELRAAAAAAAHDPGAPLALALVGDLAREQGVRETAREAYDRAASAGGVGACLAARGRAALASAAASAAAELATLADLCPASLLADPETDYVRGRARLATGDAAGAVAILSGVRDALGSAAGAGLLIELAKAAAAAGDREAARRLYEEVGRGHYGVRAAGLATVGLARLDAAGGDVAAGLERLAGLAAGQADDERRAFVAQAIAEALGRGADQDAVLLVHEHGVSVAALPAADQIRLARSYRAVGLVAEAEQLLTWLKGTLGAAAPDALYEERAATATARGDAAGALSAAEEWLRARGAAAPPVSRLWRARALAALGETAGALALAEPALAAVDGATAREVRIELATLVRAREPAAAGRLARTAIDAQGLPELSPGQAAAALRTLGDAAEATGDDAAALDAFSRLAARYGDQPSASGAAYHVARLTAGAGGGRAAITAYREVTRSADPIERRLAAAALAYETIVQPFEGLQGEP